MEADCIPEHCGLQITNTQHAATYILQPEIILLIVLHAREGNASDRRTLQDISLVCKQFNDVVQVNKEVILRHYTVTLKAHSVTFTRLFGLNHSIDDKPSQIVNHNDGEPPSLYWYHYGKLHREDDKPAIVYAGGKGIGGTHRWYWHDKLHRDNDRPASIWSDGSRFYYRMGEFHRDNGPAIERADGTRIYYVNGVLIK